MPKGGEIEVQRQLVLSTAHLSKTGREWLDMHEIRTDPVDGHTYAEGVNILTIPYRSGWIVYCDEDAAGDDDTPAEIQAAIRIAKHFGCDWLKYDADGYTIDEIISTAEGDEALPTFEYGSDKLADQAEVIDCNGEDGELFDLHNGAFQS
jgi:hypothetical protein